MDAISWLTEDSALPVAYLARRHLLGENIDTRKMKSLLRRRNEYAPTSRILAHVNDCIAKGNSKEPGKEFWGNYKKYQGAYWTLIILGNTSAECNDLARQLLEKPVIAVQISTLASRRRKAGVSCLGSRKTGKTAEKRSFWAILLQTAEVLRYKNAPVGNRCHSCAGISSTECRLRIAA